MRVIYVVWDNEFVCDGRRVSLLTPSACVIRILCYDEAGLYGWEL